MEKHYTKNMGEITYVYGVNLEEHEKVIEKQQKRKELVRNIADEDFDTLYRYYTDDEGYGVKTINYKYMEED